MNSSQIHLAFTHLPVILTLTGMVVLAIALIRKNKVAVTVALYILVAAGITALPVYFSGEGAEDIVESIPGVTETSIEKHEDLAKVAMIIVVLTALLAVAGLFRIMGQKIASVMHGLVLVFAIGATAVLAQTAHLGGQIRHTEIGPAAASIQNSGAPGNASETNNTNQNEHEDEDDD